MPPKKEKLTKSKKRVSSDGEKEDTSSEATVELLSPSEVVKMRKKTRLSQEESKENATSKTKEETPNKRMKVQRSEKKGKEKEENKEKETREKKKEKTPKVEGKRFKDGKDKVKKQGTRRKKKATDDDSDLPLVLFPCGICTKEVNDEDEAILCEAGCAFWYHRNCTGMSDFAYKSLTNEENAEWVCDKCIATKCVPLVKIKSFEDIPIET